MIVAVGDTTEAGRQLMIHRKDTEDLSEHSSNHLLQMGELPLLKTMICQDRLGTNGRNWQNGARFSHQKGQHADQQAEEVGHNAVNIQEATASDCIRQPEADEDVDDLRTNRVCNGTLDTHTGGGHVAWQPRDQIKGTQV